MISIPDNSLAVQFGNKIRRIELGNECYFSVLDIFKHYGNATNPTREWRRVESFLIEQGAITENWETLSSTDSVELRLHKFPGQGQRAIPVATQKTMLRIAQVTTFKEWEPLRQWMAGLADEHIKAATLLRTKDFATNMYLRKGMKPTHAQLRAANMWTFQEMAHHVIRLCAFGTVSKVLDLEFMTLLGETISNLKKILKNSDIRDSLPELQLRYLELGEMGFIAILRKMENGTEAEVKSLVVQVFQPLAAHLQMICAEMGIDRVTSKPLWMIEDGTRGRK